MKRFVLVAVLGTLAAVLIGPRGPLGGFWAPAAGVPKPEGALLAGFVAEGMVENIAFGVGLAVLLLGRPWFVARTATAGRATAAWLAAGWLFVSWMPHAALHLHIGLQPAALLPIEWVFHAGAILAIAVLLWALNTGTTRIRNDAATDRAGHRPAAPVARPDLSRG